MIMPEGFDLIPRLTDESSYENYMTVGLIYLWGLQSPSEFVMQYFVDIIMPKLMELRNRLGKNHLFY